MAKKSYTKVNFVALLLAIFSLAKADSEARKLWWNLAQNDLAAALNVRENWDVAKNIIMFLGDGMGIPANTAGRIYKGQKKGMNGEEGYLAWERLPNTALLKSYTVNAQVPDSGATATAFLCGVKTNFRTLAVDSSVLRGDCLSSKKTEHHTPSILQWAQEAGKDTGFVTTTRVTHATPAVLYAHTADRDWECDGNLGEKGTGCKDIADQLVSENPGKRIKLIIGGGRQLLGSPLGEPDAKACIRQDGRNLVQEWLKQKGDDGYTASYVTTTGELNSVNVSDTDFLLGLFANSHTPYEVDRKDGSLGTPSLKEMTLKAIEFLQKSSEGYFLLVEGGRIDGGQHYNKPRRALEEVLAMDEAVSAALGVIDLEDTLLIVTADHSHVMSIGGYPVRGNDILGLSGSNSTVDGLPYTTLMFTNGPGFNFSTDGKVVKRHNPATVDTRHVDYQSQTAVPLSPKETHGGEDIAVWAAGPMSHLFHRTHEQHYVAHVMAYAACVGPMAEDRCERPSHAYFTRGSSVGRKPTGTVAWSIASEIASSVRKVSNSTPAGSHIKFSTFSPALQEIIQYNEEQIISVLGTESFTRENAEPEDLEAHG